MNVLFYRYNSICEPIYINALKALEINVIEERAEMTNKDVTANELVKNLEKHLSSGVFLFVMSINYYPAISAVCNIYKIPYVSVIVDSPVLELYSDTLKNPYNRVFIFDKALYNLHKDVNPDCIFHMPLCADVASMQNVIRSSGNTGYAADVSFIGSLYTEKCPYNKVKNLPDYLRGYFDGLMQMQLEIYGCNFIYEKITDDMVQDFKKCEKIYQFPELSRKDEKAVIAYNYLNVKVSEMDRIRSLKKISENFELKLYTGSDTSMMPKAINCGFANSITQMPLIFNQSKINLQITARTIETGLSQRVWDVMSSGGFLLMNYQEEIFDYFDPGKDMDYWTCPEEMLDKISFYLGNDDIRNQICHNAYEKMISCHTPAHRMKFMLGKIV